MMQEANILNPLFRLFLLKFVFNRNSEFMFQIRDIEGNELNTY